MLENYGSSTKISDKLQERVDEEILGFIEQARAKSLQVLKKYKKQLDLISIKLIEVESLDGDQFADLMGMKKVKA